MKSATPKVLHEISGRSLVGHVLTAARELDPAELVVVVGHARERVTAHLAEAHPGVRTAHQQEQNGTGHAVRTALAELGGSVDGTVVVVCGDTPLLTGATLTALAEGHAKDQNAVTVLTAEVPDATGYGRIVRDADGAVTAIVEHKDATPSSAPSARSTPASSPSTAASSPRPWPPYAPTTARARSTSPTSSASCAARATGWAPRSPPTTARSSASTTACSSPPPAASSTTASWSRPCW